MFEQRTSFGTAVVSALAGLLFLANQASLQETKPVRDTAGKSAAPTEQRGRAAAKSTRDGRRGQDPNQSLESNRRRDAALDADYAKSRDTVLVDRETFALERALDQPISLNFDRTPLSEVVNFFHDFMRQNFVLDEVGLKRAAVETDRPISIHVESVKGRAALRAMLEPMELTFVIRDRCVVITDKQSASRCETRVYPIGDLAVVKSEGDFVNVSDDIIESIEQTVEPDHWNAAGGANRMQYQATTLSLLVHADYSTQIQVAELLGKLREAKVKAVEFAERSKIGPLEKLQLASKLEDAESDNEDAKARHDDDRDKEEVLSARVSLRGPAAKLLQALAGAFERVPSTKGK